MFIAIFAISIHHRNYESKFGYQTCFSIPKNDQSICGFVGRRQIVQPCDDLHFRHRTFDGNPKHVPSGFSSESTVSAAQSSIKGTPYGKHDVNQPISMVNICKTHSSGQNPQSSKFFPEKSLDL